MFCNQRKKARIRKASCALRGKMRYTRELDDDETNWLSDNSAGVAASMACVVVMSRGDGCWRAITRLTRQ